MKEKPSLNEIHNLVKGLRMYHFKKKSYNVVSEVLEKINAALAAGLPARSVDLSDENLLLVKSLCLLTLKPVIYAANVKDDDLAKGKG